MILAPQGGPQNHWISFELEGTKSNRLALNARVSATAGDLVQTAKFSAAEVICRKMICASILAWAITIALIGRKSFGQAGRKKR